MTYTCTMCSIEAPNEFKYQYGDREIVQPKAGLHLAIYGGYGMFTDLEDPHAYNALTAIRLCHDCSIKIIDLFPQEFQEKFFLRGHSVETCRIQSDTHPDGCHYAWF